MAKPPANSKNFYPVAQEDQILQDLQAQGFSDDERQRYMELRREGMTHQQAMMLAQNTNKVT